VSDEDSTTEAEQPQRPLLEMIPAQEQFDREVIGQNIAAARQALANAKFQYAAAKAGLPNTGGHLKQHEQDCRDAARVLETIESWAEPGLPMPSGLEIATVSDLPVATGA
jgi:hypothetical protein